MANSPKVDLAFHPPIGPAGEQDCGIRTAIMPFSLPPLGDDFVWEARDFDGFRMAMLEELAARFPERTQWTPADLEVVLVEVLAWALDQLSDMLDRVTAEAYLETARRPQSVRRLLSLFGFIANDADEREWSKNPVSMEAARRVGPKSVRQQRRMAHVGDYAEGMELHPLVRRAVSTTYWNGSWHYILVTVILWDPLTLDSNLFEVFDELDELPSFRQQLIDFHEQHGLPPIADSDTNGEICEKIRKDYLVIDSLRDWSELRRMAGQEVQFKDAIRVGVDIGLNIAIAPQYYQSEILQAVRTIFNAQEGGFFEIGRVSFGTNLYKGDVIQAVMQLEGIENVQVKTFKRSDSNVTEPQDSINLKGFEVAVCENNPEATSDGVLTIRCNGGLKG